MRGQFFRCKAGRRAVTLWSVEATIYSRYVLPHVHIRPLSLIHPHHLQHSNKMITLTRTVAVLLGTLAATITAQATNLTIVSNWSLANLARLKVPPIVDNTTDSVIFPVWPHTSLHHLSPTFDLASGYHASPASGTALDLSEPVELCISSTDGTIVQTWNMSAVDMGSPALPGLYADPNIVVFDDVYYIYSTTDGYPGWGGRTFYVWYSRDLVEWKRTSEPILTLNGTAGNVPWSDGNAWAPTIAERDGTYYLYFSGDNPTYNAKTIGVATASSPTGPFTAQPTAMITNTEPLKVGQAIDPAAFVDPATGKYYLFWGNGNAAYAELADDMISLKNETVAAVEGLTNFTEASFVVYREPYYHYTFSHGNTGLPTYYVGYATSTSVHGPWDYQGVVLHERPEEGILATGSSSTLHVPKSGEWYMAYHRFHIPGGDGVHREICLDKIEWYEDGIMEPVVPTLQGVMHPVHA